MLHFSPKSIYTFKLSIDYVIKDPFSKVLWFNAFGGSHTLERGPSTTKSMDNSNLGYMWSFGET
jgi:hypothetical protein